MAALASRNAGVGSAFFTSFNPTSVRWHSWHAGTRSPWVQQPSGSPEASAACCIGDRRGFLDVLKDGSGGAGVTPLPTPLSPRDVTTVTPSRVPGDATVTPLVTPLVTRCCFDPSHP